MSVSVSARLNTFRCALILFLVVVFNSEFD